WSPGVQSGQPQRVSPPSSATYATSHLASVGSQLIPWQSQLQWSQCSQVQVASGDGARSTEDGNGEACMQTVTRACPRPARRPGGTDSPPPGQADRRSDHED